MWGLCAAGHQLQQALLFHQVVVQTHAGLTYGLFGLNSLSRRTGHLLLGLYEQEGAA